MNDQQQIVAIVANLFAAAKARDLAAFQLLLRDDFMIHENGQRFDADGIFNLIGDAQQAGANFEWNIIEPSVYSDGDLASVAYRNCGAVTRGGLRQPVEWLETATLVRSSGNWQVAFMSSMRCAEATSPFVA